MTTVPELTHAPVTVTMCEQPRGRAPDHVDAEALMWVEGGLLHLKDATAVYDGKEEEHDWLQIPRERIITVEPCDD